jgi:hypothetical protein
LVQDFQPLRREAQAMVMVVLLLMIFAARAALACPG